MPRPSAPLPAADITAALQLCRWPVTSVGEIGSTNATLAAGLADGSVRPPQVLVAQRQTAGRGRLGRSWQAPWGSSQIVSVALAPAPVPLARRGWVGALLGLALTRALAGQLAVDARLKWPNDVLLDGRKCAGVLAELVGDALVVGAGLNLDLAREEYPPPVPGRSALPPVSVADVLPEGVEPDRVALLAATLDAFAELVQRWQDAAGDVAAAGLLAEYRERCATLGQHVTVHLPGGAHVEGLARDVTADGGLLVETAGGQRAFSAGDVVHLRPVAPSAVGWDELGRRPPTGG